MPETWGRLVKHIARFCHRQSTATTKCSSKLLQAARGRVTTRTYRGKLSPLRSTIIRICSPCASTIDLALRVHPVGCETCAGRRGTSGIIEAMRSVCEVLRWHNGSSRRVRQSECCARGRWLTINYPCRGWRTGNASFVAVDVQ
jgi:hypothetical protein